MGAKLLIVNCPLVPSARGPCSSVSTGWSMAAKDQKTPKRELQFQNIKAVNEEGFKTRFSVLYLLPHSHQFLNIRPLNISCDDCITGMWRIYKLVDLPNLVEGFIKSNGTIAARCSRFVSRAEERRGWRRPSVLTLPQSFALEGWMVSGIGSICVSWEEEGGGKEGGIVGFGRVIVRRLSLTQLVPPGDSLSLSLIPSIHGLAFYQQSEDSPLDSNSLHSIIFNYFYLSSPFSPR